MFSISHSGAFSNMPKIRMNTSQTLLFLRIYPAWFGRCQALGARKERSFWWPFCRGPQGVRVSVAKFGDPKLCPNFDGVIATIALKRQHLSAIATICHNDPRWLSEPWRSSYVMVPEMSGRSIFWSFLLCSFCFNVIPRVGQRKEFRTPHVHVAVKKVEFSMMFHDFPVNLAIWLMIIRYY